MCAPVSGPLVERQQAGQAGEPIAGDPAHGRRMRMDALAPAILPRSGVGLEVESARLMPERLETAIQHRVAHARQPLVDEHVRCAEDDAAVGVMLRLLRCLVADAHRPHAAEAGEIGGDALVERLIVNNAVDRLQRWIDVDGDGGDVVEVGLHRLRGAEPVQRADDEVGVAQPAEAVVPIALGSGRLGDRRRVRGDDGARLLEVHRASA